MVRAVNEIISGSADFLSVLQASIERILGNTSGGEVTAIDARLLELQQRLLKVANNKQNYDDLADEIDKLREKKRNYSLRMPTKKASSSASLTWLLSSSVSRNQSRNTAKSW